MLGERQDRETPRRTLTIGWLVGILALAAAAVFGVAAAEPGLIESGSRITRVPKFAHNSWHWTKCEARIQAPGATIGPPVGPSVASSPDPDHPRPRLGDLHRQLDKRKQWMGSCRVVRVANRSVPSSSLRRLAVNLGTTSLPCHRVPAAPTLCGITFVNNDDGYLFNTGFDAGDGYLMTTDGGSMWVQEGGRPVLSVQPFGNEVLRVSFSHSGCPGPCDISVDEAPPGSTDWHTLVSSQYGDGVQLATEGADNAYVALFLNPAGGAGSAHSTLLVTTDGGRSWSTVLDPCGTVNGDEYDMSAIGAAPGPELFALCTGRVGESSHFLEKSSDPTQGFLREPILPTGSFDQIAATSPTDVVVGTGPEVGSGPYSFELMDSTDGGSQWRTVVSDRVTAIQNHSLPGSTGFLGFQSPQLGWWVGDPGYIWGTTDGGSQWVRSQIWVSY